MLQLVTGYTFEEIYYLQKRLKQMGDKEKLVAKALEILIPPNFDPNQFYKKIDFSTSSSISYPIKYNIYSSEQIQKLYDEGKMCYTNAP